jgi:hypothetical protein
MIAFDGKSTCAPASVPTRNKVCMRLKAARLRVGIREVGAHEEHHIASTACVRVRARCSQEGIDALWNVVALQCQVILQVLRTCVPSAAWCRTLISLAARCDSLQDAQQG